MRFFYFIQFSGKGLHITAYLVAGYTGINLSGLDIRMPQHFTDTLDRYAFGECHGCGKRMAGAVECDVLADSAQITYFLQIRIEFLIAQYRQQKTVG